MSILNEGVTVFIGFKSVLSARFLGSEMDVAVGFLVLDVLLSGSLEADMFLSV